MKIFVLFCLFGLFVYFLPYFGIPLHSDVTWIFRMQVLDAAAPGSISDALQIAQGYPKNLFQACVDWYQYVGRFNCGDVAAFRLQARIAGGNADIWRFLQIMTLASAIYVFYLIGRKLRINKLILIPIAIGFFFSPWGVGTNYMAAETRASLLFLLSLCFVFGSGLLRATISAFFMLLAVLTKETVLAFWPLLLIVLVLENRKDLKTTGLLLISHITAGLILACYFLYLKLNFVVGSSYISSTFSQHLNIWKFISEYYRNLIPGLAYRNWQKILFNILSIGGLLWIFVKHNFNELKYRYKDNYVIMLGLVLGLVCHGLIYFLTGRMIEGHYAMPANFIFGLLILLTLNPWLDKLKILKDRKIWLQPIGIYLAIILLLVLVQVDRAWANNLNERVHNGAWQALVDEVYNKAPTNGHVVLLFKDNYMTEIAQSLEANMVLKGRYDLEFHLVIDKPDFKPDSEFLAYLVNSFNNERDPLPSVKEKRILYVRASRGENKDSSGGFPGIKVVLSSPKGFLIKRYYYNPDKKPSLLFQASDRPF
jgi:hypothetical protein